MSRLLIVFLTTVYVGWPAFADDKDKKKEKKDDKPAAQVPYDEVFDPDGQVRDIYRDALKIVLDLPKKLRRNFPEISRRLFSGDTPLTALPRVISRDEYDMLAKGTEQRARALQAFYEDYLGAQTFRDKIIPGAIIDAIVDRTGERAFRRFLKPESAKRMRSLYGPDLIRGPDGRWYALEDNLNFVGGAGDIEGARAVHERLIPKFGRRIGATNHPVGFLNEMTTRFHELASPAIGPNPDQGAFVIYGTPPYGDKEDNRLYEMMKARGAVIVEPGKKDQRVVVEKDGAYLITKTDFGVEYKKKIGFMWMNAEHAWVDWKHPAIREKALLDEARMTLEEKDLDKESAARIRKALVRDPSTRFLDLAKLEKAIRKSNVRYRDSVLDKPFVPGLLDAIMDGRLQTNSTPGIEFMGDKMFYSYVPDIIRHYLKEEPIINNVPTQRLFDMDAQGRPILNKERLANVMDNRKNLVAKIVDGRGGDGIHIGPKMKGKDWRGLEQTLAEDYTRYIIQDFTHPSILSLGKHRVRDDRIVDIRFISMLTDDGHVIVASTPWGRSNLMHGGDGKVNMSKSGTETTVYVRDCRGAVRRI